MPTGCLLTGLSGDDRSMTFLFEAERLRPFRLEDVSIPFSPPNLQLYLQNPCRRRQDQEHPRPDRQLLLSSHPGWEDTFTGGGAIAVVNDNEDESVLIASFIIAVYPPGGGGDESKLIA